MKLKLYSNGTGVKVLTINTPSTKLHFYQSISFVLVFIYCIRTMLTDKLYTKECVHVT